MILSVYVHGKEKGKGQAWPGRTCQTPANCRPCPTQRMKIVLFQEQAAPLKTSCCFESAEITEA